MEEKLMEILEKEFNLFHADLISRAFFDDNVTPTNFANGVKAIKEKEAEDDDEFIPTEFENL